MSTPVQVLMLCPSLDDFPQYAVPHPFTIRWYQAGDEQHWLAIKARSDHFHHADLAYYLNTYGANAHLLPERQAFLCDRDARPIGTTTAWFEDFAGQRYGKVNWVCIVPEAQGQGLAKPLLSVIGQRLRLLGHSRALLYTLTTRLPAIDLYQKFGFVPCVRHAADREAWDEINRGLRVPFRASEVIEAPTR
jgi:GNAT superfamily N-acetyltransferase